jgi:hypothetical protein
MSYDEYANFLTTHYIDERNMSKDFIYQRLVQRPQYRKMTYGNYNIIKSYHAPESYKQTINNIEELVNEKAIPCTASETKD